MWQPQGVFVLASLALIIAPVFALECYVCSWSPSEKRVDVCTPRNFSTSVRTHSCELGCEAVTVTDKNGNLEMFFRNCVQRGTPITGDCKTETTRALTRQVCTCDHKDLCNRSDITKPSSHHLLGLLLTAIISFAVTQN